jgi:hypothetical protein
MASTETYEKQGHHVDPLESEHSHVERIETHHTEENEKDIHKIPTLGVDLANIEADKGDDSDGKVNWTLKQILATLFLCGLYVGKFLQMCCRSSI